MYKVMRMLVWAALVVGQLYLSSLVYAGGGDFGPEQRAVPQTKVVVVQPDGNNTAIYVGAVATILAAGIGYLGVKHSRRK
jgi:hypothetical protein